MKHLYISEFAIRFTIAILYVATILALNYFGAWSH